MNWSAKLIKYKTQNRIAVLFEKNQILIERIKQIEGARWSQNQSFWHIPDTLQNRIRFRIEEQPVLSLDGID